MERSIAVIVVSSWVLVACSSETAPEGSAGSGAAASTGGGDGGSGAAGATGGGAAGGGGAMGGGGSGGAAMTGTLAAVGVGNWGLRSVTTDGAAWNICRNPSTGNDHSPDLLRNVGYGNGVFVAVGGDANSMVMRSVDGIHWEEDLHPTNSCAGEPYPPSCTNWMGAVAHGDGTWLAGGGNGALMRSTDDGQTWQGLHPNPGVNAVRSLAFGSGHFVAGTDGGNVYVSDDAGDSWTEHSVWSESMQVMFGGGTFIAKGRWWNGSSFDYGCSVSSDLGDSWSDCSADVLQTWPTAWDGSRWISGDGDTYWTSTDGVTWVSASTNNFPSQLVPFGNGYLGLRGSDAVYSDDLADWATVASNVPGFRAWMTGTIWDANLPVMGIDACVDDG